MAEPRPATRPKTPADHVVELRELVVGYAKQETIDPLRTLGRYLRFGAGGAALIGFGCWFLLLGLLRGLQTIELFNDPTELSGGTWSFVPYVITVLVAAGMIGLAVWGIARNTGDGNRS